MTSSKVDPTVSQHQPPSTQELLATATRTLLASGFRITAADRHPRHLEINCERPTRLGVLLRFRIAITSKDSFHTADKKAVARAAEIEGRAVLLVARSAGEGQVCWDEFLASMGGAVPSWKALADPYESSLITAAKNEVPPGWVGDAWAAFEELAADGLEFAFGRKVGRYGGIRRGLRVSDMVAQLPDSSLLVVDTKAYSKGMDVGWPSLRPLREYVENQKRYQANQNVIIGALLLSSSFKQDAKSLGALSQEFLGYAGVPLSLMTAKTLASVIKVLRQQVDVRSAVPWKVIFSGGLVTDTWALKQIRRVSDERFRSKEF